MVLWIIFIRLIEVEVSNYWVVPFLSCSSGLNKEKRHWTTVHNQREINIGIYVIKHRYQIIGELNLCFKIAISRKLKPKKDVHLHYRFNTLENKKYLGYWIIYNESLRLYCILENTKYKIYCISTSHEYQVVTTRGTSSTMRAGWSNPAGGKGRKRRQQSQRQLLFSPLGVPKDDQATQLL